MTSLESVHLGRIRKIILELLLCIALLGCNGDDRKARIGEMNEERFWKIIDESGRDASDPEEQVEILIEMLTQESPENILEFYKILENKRIESYTYDLWAIGYIVNGGCSDDGFEYFRCWVISQGRKFYERALADPASIAEVTDPGIDYYENEGLLYASQQAYEAVTGIQMPIEIRAFPSEPKGERWLEEDLPKRFPDVCKKYGLQ